MIGDDQSPTDRIFKKRCARECRAEKLELFSMYRYVLSFENTIDDTEYWTRVWDCWYSGN